MSEFFIRYEISAKAKSEYTQHHIDARMAQLEKIRDQQQIDNDVDGLRETNREFLYLSKLRFKPHN